MKNSHNSIPADLADQLRAVAALPDDAIDTSDPDAPEVTDWSGAVRGRLHQQEQDSVLALAIIAEDAIEALERVSPEHVAVILGRRALPPGITDVPLLAGRAAAAAGHKSLETTLWRVRGERDGKGSMPILD